MLAAADLRAELAVSASGLSLALFTAPLLLCGLAESVVLAWSDSRDRRPLIALALLAQTFGMLAIAASEGLVALALAMTMWGLGAGVSSSLAEAALIELHPDDGDRVMSRWGRLGALGDLLAPALFGGLAALGLGWRATVLLSAGVAALDAWWVWRGPPLPAGGAEEEDRGGPAGLDALRAALGDVRLMGWLAAAALCTLMDELLVAFAAQWARAAGVGPEVQSAQMAAFSAGAVLGLSLSERALARWSGHAQLLVCGPVAAALYVAWLCSGGAVLGALAMGALGTAVAPMWTLATAAAYARGARPGLVAALGNLFLPFELFAPAAVGLAADRWGLGPAMLLLLAQPLGVALLAWRLRTHETEQE